MFILEESQLLEDTIHSAEVLNLYKVLRKNDSNGDRQPLLELLTNEKFKTAVELLAEYQKLHGQDLKLTPELRENLFAKLDLQKSDCVALYLVVAATLNQLFVIDNFTGPSASSQQELLKNLPDVYSNLKGQFSFSSLTSDGYEVYHLIENPWLLKTVQLCWNLLSNIGASRRLAELEFLVWKHRYLTIHLLLLHEPSEFILKELNKVHEFIFDHHIINDARENKTQLTRFNIVSLCCELVQSAILRDGITSSRKIFDYASDISGITIEHTGVLGKRTRFQQNDIPQLVIRVSNPNIDDPNALEKLCKPEGLPKDMALDDDTLLPDISFVKDSGEGMSVCTEQELCPEAQLLMLTRLDYILKTEVMEESLKNEWTLAYVRSIINSASLWAVKYKALAIRSFCEKKQMRKMDRALLQLEELIKETDRNDKESDIRMQQFYATLPLSRWQMQRSLGDISFDLCLFKNALEVYQRIEYWEGMIKCYSALNENNKAESVIRQELAKQETPYLYCLLGDATENIEYYEKSWTLSKESFARAKKSIGTYYYVRKNYEEAINNYELALKASPSNVSILSMLAYSCLILERYERAAECYRNLTYQDDGNFLAWNNLSKAYIKLNQKERAWRTLREAIKCNFEEWKIWENFMLVAVEIGALDDVIIAWHRLVDIKQSHKDDRVLSALTFSIIKRSYVKSDSEFMKLLGDSLKLVGRISMTGACSTRVWICYFRLLAREFDLVKQNGTSEGKPMTTFDINSRLSKLINTLQRATPNTLVLGNNWFTSPEQVDKILSDYDELSDCYQLLLNLVGARNEIWTQWKSYKLSLENTLKTLKQKGGYDYSNAK